MADIKTYPSIETRNGSDVVISSPTSILRFLGAGVTVSQVGDQTRVNIPGGAGALGVLNNGTTVVPAFTELNFTGVGWTITESPTGRANISFSGAISGVANSIPYFNGSAAFTTDNNLRFTNRNLLLGTAASAPTGANQNFNVLVGSASIATAVVPASTQGLVLIGTTFTSPNTSIATSIAAGSLFLGAGNASFKIASAPNPVLIVGFSNVVDTRAAGSVIAGSLVMVGDGNQLIRNTGVPVFAACVMIGRNNISNNNSISNTGTRTYVIGEENQCVNDIYPTWFAYGIGLNANSNPSTEFPGTKIQLGSYNEDTTETADYRIEIGSGGVSTARRTSWGIDRLTGINIAHLAIATRRVIKTTGTIVGSNPGEEFSGFLELNYAAPSTLSLGGGSFQKIGQRITLANVGTSNITLNTIAGTQRVPGGSIVLDQFDVAEFIYTSAGWLCTSFQPNA